MGHTLGGGSVSIKRRGPLPAQRFTMIPNDWVRDERLSFRARGVLAYLMALQDDEPVTLATLNRAGAEGRDAIRTALAELIEAGYLDRQRTRDDDGKLNGVAYVVTGPPTEQRRSG